LNAEITSKTIFRKRNLVLLFIWASLQYSAPVLCDSTRDFATLRTNIHHMIDTKHEEETIPLLEQMAKVPVTPYNQEDMAECHYLLGRFYFDYLSKSEKAVEEITKAMELKPKKISSGDLFYLRGVYRSQENHFEASAEDLEKAIKLKPNDPACLYRLGNVYCFLKNDDKAASYYTQVITGVPPSNSLYRKCLFGRAQIYERQKQWQKAVADYNALSKVSLPEGLYLTRAHCYEQLHQLDKAMADYNRMVEYDPDNDDARRRRGDLLLILGKTKEAFIDYDQAIKINPSLTNYRTRAAAYEKIGKKDLAALDQKEAASK